jgi:hypothetical protein
MLRLLNKLFSIDPRSLAAFRIVAGLIVLVDLAIRATDLSAFYTDASVIPRSMSSWAGFPSIYMLTGSAEWAGFFMLLAGLAAVALILGWQTRLATILTWYFLAAIHARASILLISGDSLLRMMLFWGMFLPLGRAWSIDAWRSGTLRKSLKPVFSVATISVLLQTCLLYWFAAYYKLNDVWFDGLALYHTFSFDAYARPMASYMLQFPTLLVYLGYATLVLEGIGPFVAFIPWKLSFWRMLTIAAFVGLHVSIDLTMTVGIFSKVSLLVWIPYLPAVFWDKLTGRRTSDAGSTEAPQPTPLWPTGWAAKFATVVCSIALVYVLLICYAYTALPGARSKLIRSVARSADTTMFRQNWGVYGYPNRNDGWCIVAARLANGRMVDLLRGGAALDFEKPACISYIHPNHRWRTIFFEITVDGTKQYRPRLCRFLAEHWDATHPENEKVLSVDLYLVDEWTPDPGEPVKLQQVLLHHERMAAQGAFDEAAGELQQKPGEQGAADDLPPGL